MRVLDLPISHMWTDMISRRKISHRNVVLMYDLRTCQILHRSACRGGDAVANPRNHKRAWYHWTQTKRHTTFGLSGFSP